MGAKQKRQAPGLHIFCMKAVPDNEHCTVVQASKTKAPASGTPDGSPARKVQRISSAKGRGSRLSHTATAAAEEAAAETEDLPAATGEAAVGQAAAAPREAAAGLDAAALAETAAAGDHARKRKKKNRRNQGLPVLLRQPMRTSRNLRQPASCACLVLCSGSLCDSNSLTQLLC